MDIFLILKVLSTYIIINITDKSYIMNNKSIKFLSSTSTKLFMSLLSQGQHTFTLQKAHEITLLKDQSLLNFIQKLQKRGLITRIENGLYNIVPLEMGESHEYLGNTYAIASELVKKKLKNSNPDYYLSHSSAMDIHQMVTQPQFIVYTTVKKQILSKNILGTHFKFVTVKPEYFFGKTKHRISNTESVFVSDLEKTIIDGLKSPEYCGGITEIAKGFWMKREQMNLEKLVSYAEKMQIGAVNSRLGFILQAYKILNDDFSARLKKTLNKSHILFDPNLINEGPYNSEWKLRINVSPEELISTVRT